MASRILNHVLGGNYCTLEARVTCLYILLHYNKNWYNKDKYVIQAMYTCSNFSPMKSKVSPSR